MESAILSLSAPAHCSVQTPPGSNHGLPNSRSPTVCFSKNNHGLQGNGYQRTLLMQLPVRQQKEREPSSSLCRFRPSYTPRRGGRPAKQIITKETPRTEGEPCIRILCRNPTLGHAAQKGGCRAGFQGPLGKGIPSLQQDPRTSESQNRPGLDSLSVKSADGLTAIISYNRGILRNIHIKVSYSKTWLENRKTLN